MRALCLVAAVAAPLVACQPPDTSADAKQAIDATNAEWARLTSAAKADSITEFFHPQAVLYAPNTPAVRGRDAIRAFFAFMNTISTPPPTLVIRADSVWATGSSAVELGRWTFSWPAGATRPPGAPAVDSGKYIVRWVQEGGRWLMMHDIWNSDLPLPGAP